MSKIVLLEDDPILGKAIQLQLELDDFQVVWAKTLSEARSLFRENPNTDLFLLDVNVPDGSGFDFCKWLRSEGVTTPVIFITARTDEESVIAGFTQGANDYIRKPFSHREVLVRIKNQLGDKKASLDILRFAGLSLITNQQVLKHNDNMISLNRREFQILHVFFNQPETVVSREQLIEKLDSGDEIFDRTVDSHISHIRAKLQKNGISGVRIASVYGQGYRLERIS